MFQHYGEKLKIWGNSVKASAARHSAKSSVGYRLEELQPILDEAYMQLGKAFFEKAKEAVPEEYAELFQGVQKVLDEMAANEKKLEDANTQYEERKSELARQREELKAREEAEAAQRREEAEKRKEEAARLKEEERLRAEQEKAQAEEAAKAKAEEEARAAEQAKAEEQESQPEFLRSGEAASPFATENTPDPFDPANAPLSAEMEEVTPAGGEDAVKDPFSVD